MAFLKKLKKGLDIASKLAPVAIGIGAIASGVRARKDSQSDIKPQKERIESVNYRENSYESMGTVTPHMALTIPGAIKPIKLPNTSTPTTDDEVRQAARRTRSQANFKHLRGKL